MNIFRPVRIRSQLPAAFRMRAHARTANTGLAHPAYPRSGAPAGWWLTRMLVQSHELDDLISDLRHQRRCLPSECSARPWRRPSWLEASVPLALVRDEYDALILALSARRADLSRTYLPLMRAMKAGNPVPVAVVSIIVA